MKFVRLPVAKTIKFSAEDGERISTVALDRRLAESELIRALVRDGLERLNTSGKVGENSAVDT